VNIGFVGLGKLGLPVAVAIDSKGHNVVGFDIDSKVRDYLKKGEIPYREEGLHELLVNHRVGWCDTVADVVAQSDLIFVAIQTPHQEQYEGITPLPEDRADFDYSHLTRAIHVIANTCADQKVKRTVAVISTCLPGTFDREIKPLLNEYVSYVYTPQFIAMGTVVHDYLNPEFNLVGVDDIDAAEQLGEFYYTMNDAVCVRTDIKTAEGIKVSYNTWITAKTVIANAWGELCERTGMNFDDMLKAWSLSDRRLISTRYMDAGMSDGGGCHPRDNIALSWLANEVEMSHNIWEDLMAAREDYEAWHAACASFMAKEIDLPLVLLGTAFKPETDIETGSPAMLMANILRSYGTQFLHVNDLSPLPPAVYFIATKNKRYKFYEFPPGSIVLDPFGYIPDRDGVMVRRMGRR
jgi:UDPglucose 6-dehydrogenase